MLELKDVLPNTHSSHEFRPFSTFYFKSLILSGMAYGF